MVGRREQCGRRLGYERRGGAAGLAPTNDWQHYVYGPRGRDVTPIWVLSTAGDVKNPTALHARENVLHPPGNRARRHPRPDRSTRFGVLQQLNSGDDA